MCLHDKRIVYATRYIVSDLYSSIVYQEDAIESKKLINLGFNES